MKPFELIGGPADGDIALIEDENSPLEWIERDSTQVEGLSHIYEYDPDDRVYYWTGSNKD